MGGYLAEGTVCGFVEGSETERADVAEGVAAGGEGEVAFFHRVAADKTELLVVIHVGAVCVVCRLERRGGEARRFAWRACGVT
jgi:cytochrome b